MQIKGFPICPYYAIRAHVCHTGDPTGGKCKDSLQHPGSLQRGLHSGHLHPRHRGNAKGLSPEDGQLHGPASGVKIQRENEEVPGSAPGTSSKFLVWVLFGSKQKGTKFRRIKLSKKQDKSPDFAENQEICGRSAGIRTPGLLVPNVRSNALVSPSPYYLVTPNPYCHKAFGLYDGKRPLNSGKDSRKHSVLMSKRACRGTSPDPVCRVRAGNLSSAAH